MSLFLRRCITTSLYRANRCSVTSLVSEYTFLELGGMYILSSPVHKEEVTAHHFHNDALPGHHIPDRSTVCSITCYLRCGQIFVFMWAEQGWSSTVHPLKTINRTLMSQLTLTHTALQLQNTFIIQLFGESFMSSAHLQLVWGRPMSTSLQIRLPALPQLVSKGTSQSTLNYCITIPFCNKYMTGHNGSCNGRSCMISSNKLTETVYCSFKLFVPCIFSTYGIKTNWCHYFSFIHILPDLYMFRAHRPHCILPH